MKTLKHKSPHVLVLIFIASILFISCSDDNDGIRYTNTPGEATLSLPLNNEACEVGEIIDNRATVTFSWNEADNTEKYDLIIINLITQEINPNFNLTNNTIDVILERGYPYSWKITTKNSGDEITESETWNFYLSTEGESNGVPFPTKLLSPSSGATITPTDGKVTLSWEGSSDADGDTVTYNLYADKVDGKQEISNTWRELTDTSIEIDVEANTIYFWRVETSDGINSAFSTTYTFKTAE